MLNVLIVDDDPQSTWTISKLLESMGYGSLFLLESEYLFQMLEKRKVDLILLDISMPGTDVLSLLKSLKNHDVYQTIPVMMLTESNEDKLLECIELGALDFIHKPVERQNLDARMKLFANIAKTNHVFTRSFLNIKHTF